VRKKLSNLREYEQIYKCLFEACGKCKLPDEAWALYKDMQSSKGKVEVDKLTMGAFFHAITTNSSDY